MSAITIRREMMQRVNPARDPAIKFQASGGWFTRFIKRHNLVVRRISGSGRELPKDCCVQIKEYLQKANTIMKEYSTNAIISFDETSIYADMLGSFTYEQKGKSKVSAVSSGNEKTRLSCLMASTMSGKKLPVIVVIPRKRPFQNFLHNENVVIVYETGGTSFLNLDI